MEFQDWRTAVLKSIKEKGFRATSRDFGIGLSSLRNIQLGDDYAGFQTWKHLETNWKPKK